MVGVALVAALLASGALDDVDSGAVVVTVTDDGSEPPDPHPAIARSGRAIAERVFAIRVRIWDLTGGDRWNCRVYGPRMTSGGCMLSPSSSALHPNRPLFLASMDAAEFGCRVIKPHQARLLLAMNYRGDVGEARLFAPEYRGGRAP